MAGAVVVVDDHRLVAGPLVTVLTPLLAAHGFTLRPLAATVAACIASGPPGLAVCDVILGAGASGAEAVKELVAHRWKVLLISGYAPEEQVLDAIAAGAGGYLEKSEDPAGLVAAVRAVDFEGLHLSAALAAMLYADLRRRPRPAGSELSTGDQRVLRAFVQGEPLDRAARSCGLTVDQARAAVRRIFTAAVARRQQHQLTPRELEVVRLVGCEHLSTAAVARRLYVSIDTANTHLRSIRRKYHLVHPEAPANLPQRTAAQLWARELNLC
ncbi:response regulator transcription factor [Dactylosporangium sp. CS-033363]|uniref:response regulator transcription factor n=1 Tax=Dactylosporangium sp. CS-033363 TaxID=3239935 RepID=UPI003D93CBCC